MSPTSAIFDPGLQPERTALAWRRTALAIAVGSLVTLRSLPAITPTTWSPLVGSAGLGLATLTFVAAEYRNRLTRTHLVSGAPIRLGGAGLLALTSLTTMALGLLCLVIVLSGRS